jgi:hypothetical protein
MDLAQDILRLAEKVAQVPGLSVVFSLAVEILKAVQVSVFIVIPLCLPMAFVQIAKNNKKRLRELAHLVADNLIAIADHVHGKWDDVPDKVKGILDEFDASVFSCRLSEIVLTFLLQRPTQYIQSCDQILKDFAFSSSCECR